MRGHAVFHNFFLFNQSQQIKLYTLLFICIIIIEKIVKTYLNLCNIIPFPDYKFELNLFFLTETKSRVR